MIAYYSTSSENTHRFVLRLGVPHLRIPSAGLVRQPFILVTPTYNGRVPVPVLTFLRDPETRYWLRGVVASGNMNFGSDYAAAGRAIAHKCEVPLLHTFELSGLPTDIDIVRAEVENLWSQVEHLTAS